MPVGTKTPKVNVQSNSNNTIQQNSPFSYPFMPYLPYPGYHTPPPPYPQHHGGFPPSLPHPQTPSAQIRTSNPQSSPINFSTQSNGTPKVAQYMDWFIVRHPTEIEALTVVKARLLATGTDMEGIQ